MLAALLGPWTGNLVHADDAQVSKVDESGPSSQDRPNIVLVLLDDVAFADTSTFGGVAQTPALTQLAAEGLRYTRFHTVGICSPTRAALLSGRNHHRIGYGSLSPADYPGYHQIWPKAAASIAQVLERNGYSTAAFGKWHNTPRQEITPAGPFDRWPTGLGFEYFYGNMMGMTSQWEPSLWRNTVPVQQPKTVAQGYHMTTDLVDDAIHWIQTHESLAPEKPYFIYFATAAAHVPHHVSKEWIAQYRGRFDQGWDRLREEIYVRQKRLGVIPPEAKLTPRPKELPAWTSLSAEQRLFFARQMEVYAAFVAQTDYEIGRLVRSVRKTPRGANTLVLYIVGDNGGEARVWDGAEDMSVYAGPQNQRPIQERLASAEELGSSKYTNVYSAGWAWAGSTPFQWTKGVASHFGASRNPLVVSWPARIKNIGELRTQFTHVIDIAPTVYEIAGIPAPESLDGVRQMPLDGVSFADTFDDANISARHRVQYFELYGNRAIYNDGWLAAARHEVPWVAEDNENFTQDQWELYQIDRDFSEAHDVAGRYPERLAEMKALFDREARRNEVYPLMKGAFHRASSTSTSSGQKPKTSVFHQGFPGIPAPYGPDFRGSSFLIVAELAAAGSRATDGVILGWGGRDSGFSLYIKDNHLIYDTNYFGRIRRTLRDEQPLPGGQVEVRLDYAHQSQGSGGIGSLYVNGRSVGTLQLPEGLGWSLDNFDIGQDSASPVTDAYQAPFAFAGNIQKVTITLRSKGAATPAVRTNVESE